jgi:nucleotide-binding universal stress UspA family protein
MLSQVLVSLDGSELAERALPYAKQIVAPTGEIILLSVVDIPDFPIYTVYPMATINPEPDYSTVVSDLLASSKEYLEGIANNIRLAGFRVKTIVKSGDPASCIIEEAQERHVDTIVISTHGRSGLSKWLFGSVTQKVLSAMPCPVIVIPGIDKKGEQAEAKADAVEV